MGQDVGCEYLTFDKSSGRCNKSRSKSASLVKDKRRFRTSWKTGKQSEKNVKKTVVFFGLSPSFHRRTQSAFCKFSKIVRLKNGVLERTNERQLARALPTAHNACARASVAHVARPCALVAFLAR